MANESKTSKVDSQAYGKRKSPIVIFSICMLAVGVFAIQGLIATKSSAQLRNFICDRSIVKSESSNQNVDCQDSGFLGCLSSLEEEDIEKGVSHMVKRISNRIDGTMVQERQIFDVVVPAMIKAKQIGISLSKSRENLQELITADTIDRNATEKIRADGIAEIDTLSEDWTAVLAQVAEILTVEQKEKINDKFSSRIRWM